jgi:hypothetical protein
MRQWDLQTVTNIIIACIIIYNMIIEDEQYLGLEQLFCNQPGVGLMHKDFSYRDLEVGTREI